jgi:hypothetical protein
MSLTPLHIANPSLGSSAVGIKKGERDKRERERRGRREERGAKNNKI